MSSTGTVLVTGAGGFIGSHLAEALVKEGKTVRAFVRYNSRNDWGSLADLEADVLGSIEVIAGDIKDPEAVRRAVKGCDVVHHLAALIGIPFSYTNPRDYVDTNVTGTANVLNAAREYGLRRLVCTSTSEVYGTARFTPITEEHPLQAQSPYSASKIGADKLAESYFTSFDLPVTILRPFNTFGPRQSARAIIPTIIVQALTRDVIELGSLDPLRDLNFVANTVSAFILCAARDEAIGQVINAGSGREISVGDLAQSILKIMDVNKPIVQDKARVRPPKSEVGQLIASNAKAAELLGWTPGVGLSEGLALTIDWFRAHHARYKAEIYNV